NGLDFRLSAVKTDQSQGYFKNLAGGPGEGGVVHDWYAEAQLEWKPTDRDDAWLLLSSQGLDNDRSGPGALLGTPTLGAYNVSIIAPDSPAIFNPNFGYSRLSGFSPCLNPQLGCLPLPNQEPTGLALGPIPGSVTGAVPGLTNNPALTNIRNFAHSVPTNIRAGDTYNINFHYIHHFDGFDMKYVGGYMQYHYHLVSGLPDEDNSSITSYQIPLYPTGLCATGALGPCAPLTVFPSQVYSYNDYNRWMSHEITFSSTTNGPLQWIAGVYYFDEHYRSPITVAQPQQAQFAAPFYPLVPSATSPLNPFGLVPAPANPQRIWYNTSYALATQSTAGYVQLDYKVTDAVKLTGGVRYTYDKKYGDEEYRQLAFSDLLAAPPSNAFTAEDLGTSLPAIDITSAEIATGPYKGVTCLPFLLANGAYKRCLGDSSNAVTGTAGVEWTPDSATLAYIRYNRGYKAFGLNVGTIIADPEAKPEFVDDFEIGLKQTLGRTFQYSADAFYYNYVNDQVPVYVVSNALVQNEFFNIPRAVSEGFELQAEWDPIEHLDMTLTYAFDHTAILSGCNAANPQGSTCLIDAVDPSALAVGARPVGAAGGGYVYQSVKGGPLPQAPENKVSLNVNYTWEFDPGNFTLSGSYIWKDSSYPTVFKRWYYETPSWSQVDLRALWIGDHDRYEIIGFAKNLFNTIGYDAAFDAYGSTLPYGQDPAYELTPPRTYGVEVHVKF
ncbi:MAG TPA: TonB-dependent receptor, partial [Caulobacteraceae bacterium]|nr:TonB-dependent receptor [Caulobacteraceae bacterium]